MNRNDESVINQSPPPPPVGAPLKKKSNSNDKYSKKDVPPPLPQRNAPKKSNKSKSDEVVLRRDSTTNISDEKLISDLDKSIGSPSSSSLNLSTQSTSDKSSAGGKNKKRSKTKTKALSDPKMSSQSFIDMETNEYMKTEPPPLPPRQPGMLEENLKSNNNQQSTNLNKSFNRPLPNSIETIMNYPLISTCTPVRDNLFDAAAFPFSHRPNIVQHLHKQQHHHQHQQQHQQQHYQQQQQQLHYQQQQPHFLHHHHSNASSSSNKNSTVSNFFISSYIKITYFTRISQLFMLTHIMHNIQYTYT